MPLTTYAKHCSVCQKKGWAPRRAKIYFLQVKATSDLEGHQLLAWLPVQLPNPYWNVLMTSLLLEPYNQWLIQKAAQKMSNPHHLSAGTLQHSESHLYWTNQKCMIFSSVQRSQEKKNHCCTGQKCIIQHSNRDGNYLTRTGTHHHYTFHLHAQVADTPCTWLRAQGLNLAFSI